MLLSSAGIVMPGTKVNVVVKYNGSAPIAGNHKMLVLSAALSEGAECAARRFSDRAFEWKQHISPVMKVFKDRRNVLGADPATAH